MFTGISPVFSVRDVTAALAHYRRLGFAVEAYKGDAAYGYARRDNTLLHLAEVPVVDPLTNAG